MSSFLLERKRRSRFRSANGAGLRPPHPTLNANSPGGIMPQATEEPGASGRRRRSGPGQMNGHGAAARRRQIHERMPGADQHLRQRRRDHRRCGSGGRVGPRKIVVGVDAEFRRRALVTQRSDAFRHRASVSGFLPPMRRNGARTSLLSHIPNCHQGEALMRSR